MIYLSGHAREDLPGVGVMCTPNSESVPPPGVAWAADNGRFAAPEAYSDESYLSWLGRWSPSLCLFATAPDVLGDAAATLEMSRQLFPRIRLAGYKAALVAQDGFDGAPWDEFDCLFIGGTTAFKLGSSVPGIVAEARRRGKWTHMGRVNSYKRLRVAAAIGCRSADGTFLKFAPDHNAGRMMRWIERLDSQMMMEMTP